MIHNPAVIQGLKLTFCVELVSCSRNSPPVPNTATTTKGQLSQILYSDVTAQSANAQGDPPLHQDLYHPLLSMR